METLLLSDHCPDDIQRAGDILRQGGLVAIPTETVYGLAADAENSAAIWTLFEVKQREREKAFSILVTGMDMVERYCENIPPVAYALAEKYWPGPLTMILEDKGVVSALVNDEGDTLGVRDLPSPKTAQEVLDYFDGHIEGIVDGGPCAMGVESTIVDLTGDEPVILREGGIPAQELLDFIREHQA